MDAAPDERPIGRVVDPQLVVAAQGGDREAFATLARSSGDRLFGIARRILRDHERAEDAVQNALVIAWRELPRLRDPDRFEAWLTRLLVNDCYEDYRRTRRHDAHVRTLPVDGPVGPDETQRVLDRDQLDRGFGRLQPDQRAVLVLRHYLGLDPVEIARTLDIPEGTVRSRLHYAYRAMRAAIEADLRPATEEGGSA
ncbi:MAG TPA: RNA polymerase sigma factor [Candidatus Limnocylindrales bacterium]|nr:RNA polymerase sigma factor [Candidatus Limnocylindrales bacterium]